MNHLRGHFWNDNGVKVPDVPEDDGAAAAEVKALSASQALVVSYPKSVQFLFIMLALWLGITIISSDQVSFNAPRLLEDPLCQTFT